MSKEEPVDSITLEPSDEIISIHIEPPLASEEGTLSNDEASSSEVNNREGLKVEPGAFDNASNSDLSIASSEALKCINSTDILLEHSTNPSNNEQIDQTTTTEEFKERTFGVTFAEPLEQRDEKAEIDEMKKTLRKSQFKHMFSRFFLTIAYFIIMFAFGASQSIVGPCLSFLTVNVNATSSTIGWIFTLKGLGSITGTLFGGKILDIIAEQLSNFRGCLYEWKKKRQIKKDPNSTDTLDSAEEIEKIRSLSPLKKYIARNYAIHSYFASCVLVLVGSLVATPFVRDFGLLLFVYFMFGLGSGLTVMQGNVLCAWLWGNYAATALLLNSAIIGLGAFLCPIILNGLIASDTHATVSATNSTTSSFEFVFEQSILDTFQNSTSNSTSVDINAIVNGNWRFTYVIIGGILFLSVAVILPIFQIILTKFELFRLHGVISVDAIDEDIMIKTIEASKKKPKEEEYEMKQSPSMVNNEMIPSESTADFLEKEAQKEREEQIEEKEIKESKTFGIIVSKIVDWYHKLRTYRAFILFALGFFFAFGIETSIGGLISTYLLNYVGTTDISQASLMVSIYYLSMTIARIISGIFSYFLQKVFRFTQTLVITISYLGLISGIIVMLSIPQNSMVGCWIGIILIGASISTFIPSYISYPAATEMRDVHLSGFLTSFLFVLSSVGEMTIPLLITNCFSWFGFHSFFWVILIVALLMGVTTAWLFLMSFELRARIHSLFLKVRK